MLLPTLSHVENEEEVDSRQQGYPPNRHPPLVEGRGSRIVPLPPEDHGPQREQGRGLDAYLGGV